MVDDFHFRAELSTPVRVRTVGSAISGHWVVPTYFQLPFLQNTKTIYYCIHYIKEDNESFLLLPLFLNSDRPFTRDEDLKIGAS